MSLCIQCNAKPQFQGHPYCGKNCAQAAKAGPAKATPGAAGMCIRCGVKPRYGGHPYCGKTCAKAGGPSASSTTAVGKCMYCHVKPKYGGHPYCGKTCARAAAAIKPSTNANGKCNHCHVKPQYNGHPYCSKSCARAAAATKTSISANGKCVRCHVRPQFNGLPYCGKTCANAAAATGPSLVHLSPSDQSYKSVAKQFNDTWKQLTPVPKIRHIYRTIPSPAVKQQYENYRRSIDSSPEFKRRPGMAPGNERRRWHGTCRACCLGDDPSQTSFCSDKNCSLCSILQDTLRVPKRRPHPFERFGRGIYTSAVSSESANPFLYCKSTTSPFRALLLVKVAVGRCYKQPILLPANFLASGPPAGYHAIRSGYTGPLTQEELVVYRDDATCPAYLVIF